MLHDGPALTPALGVTTGDAGAGTGTTTVTETLTLATYDSAGSQLTSSSYSTSTPASTDPNHSTFGFGIAFPVGDLEPDSAVDGLAFLFITSGNNRNSEQVLFHGVNGRALTDQKRAPLGASTTGHGQDLTRTATGKNGNVAVLRGRDDPPLFTRSVPGTNGISSAHAAGAVLQRGHCADVLIIGQGRDTSLLADLASNGQPRWTLIR